MTRRAAAVALVALAVGVLPACGGDGKGGTDASATTTTTTGVGDAASGAVTSSSANSPAKSTAPTSVRQAGSGEGGSAAPAVGEKLAFPKLGRYKFHDTVTVEGQAPNERDSFFRLSSPSARVVRVQEADAAGKPKNSAFYDERYDDDGLWLVGSATTGGTCSWSPKAASLPQRVIDGGRLTTSASCTTGEATLRLETTLTFKAVRDVTIGGRVYRSVDVTRHRVLSDGTATITSDAVDTYALKLGLRIATTEQTTTQAPQGTSTFNRNLVLVSPPS